MHTTMRCRLRIGLLTVSVLILCISGLCMRVDASSSNSKRQRREQQTNDPAARKLAHLLQFSEDSDAEDGQHQDMKLTSSTDDDGVSRAKRGNVAGKAAAAGNAGFAKKEARVVAASSSLSSSDGSGDEASDTSLTSSTSSDSDGNDKGLTKAAKAGRRQPQRWQQERKAVGHIANDGFGARRRRRRRGSRRRRHAQLQEMLQMQEYRGASPAAPARSAEDREGIGADELRMYQHVETVLDDSLTNEQRNRAGAKQIYRMWKVQRVQWDKATEEAKMQAEQARVIRAELDRREAEARAAKPYPSGSLLRDIARRREALSVSDEARQVYMKRKLAVLQQLMDRMNAIKTLHRKTERTFHKLLRGMAKTLRALDQGAPKENEKGKTL